MLVHIWWSGQQWPISIHNHHSFSLNGQNQWILARMVLLSLWVGVKHVFWWQRPFASSIGTHLQWRTLCLLTYRAGRIVVWPDQLFCLSPNDPFPCEAPYTPAYDISLEVRFVCVCHLPFWEYYLGQFPISSIGVAAVLLLAILHGFLEQWVLDQTSSSIVLIR